MSAHLRRTEAAGKNGMRRRCRGGCPTNGDASKTHFVSLRVHPIGRVFIVSGSVAGALLRYPVTRTRVPMRAHLLESTVRAGATREGGGGERGRDSGMHACIQACVSGRRQAPDAMRIHTLNGVRSSGHTHAHTHNRGDRGKGNGGGPAWQKREWGKGVVTAGDDALPRWRAPAPRASGEGIAGMKGNGRGKTAWMAGERTSHHHSNHKHGHIHAYIH